MANPVIATNTLSPFTVNPGGSTTWTTRATDPDARTASITRTVKDAAGGQVVFTSTLVVEDPLTYGVPTSSDPGVSFVVDPADPTIVHINVAS